VDADIDVEHVFQRQIGFRFSPAGCARLLMKSSEGADRSRIDHPPSADRLTSWLRPILIIST
jgi:hypothetical protein